MKKLLLIPVLFSGLLAFSQVFQSGVGVLQHATTELQAYAAGYQLAHPDSVNKLIFLYASSVTTEENPRPVFTGGTTANQFNNTGESNSQWADLMLKNNWIIGTIVSLDSKDAPVYLPAASAFTEQHDVNTIAYYNTAGVQYASLTSTINGGPALALLVSSNAVPGNQKGSISIVQRSGEAYGIFLDSTGVVFGSDQNRGRLSLSAGTVFTTGNIESTGFIKAGTGLVVGDADQSNLAGSQKTMAYFASSSRESTDVVISNQYWGSGSNAGAIISLSGSSSSLYAYSNDPMKYGMNAGSLVVYSQSDNGILFNTVQNNPSIQPEIRFAINSKIIGAFIDGGFESEGLTSNEILSIPNPHEGMEVYNRTIRRQCFYDGKIWQVSECYPLTKNL